ncbi:MAG TPA: hypothetical protein VM487_21100 [Phycisphaerae bacterium]|nr:hypothetical protein [Phycisphaerae bacterium]
MATYNDPGLYDFQVISQGFGHAKNEKNTPYFFLEGKPVGRVEGEEVYQYDGGEYLRTITFYITENTTDFVVDQVMSLGWDGQKWADLDPSESLKCDLRGKVIRARCNHKASMKDQSKLFEEWSLPGAARGPQESEASVARKLDGLYGKQMKKKAGAKPRTLSRELAEEAAAMGAEDVPF